MQLSNLFNPELLWVLVLVVVLFGAKNIPQLFKGLGEGIKEFKKATRDLSEEETPPPPARREEPAAAESKDTTTGKGAGQ